MMNNRTITISEQEFYDKIKKAVRPFIKDPTFAIILGMFSGDIHRELFGEPTDTNADTDTDTEAPFKIGDKVFVTDNKGDNNHIVNQVVTVTKVTNNHDCYVTNGEHEQRIYFKNLRKVETP